MMSQTVKPSLIWPVKNIAFVFFVEVRPKTL